MSQNSAPIQPALDNESLAKQERNAYRISLVTGILMAVISVVSTISTILTGLYSFSGIAVTSIISIVAFISAWLSRHGKTQRGALLLLSAILLLSLTLPLSAKGQGLALAAMTIILVTSISTTTLPPRLAGRIVATSLASGILLIFLDLFLPYKGLPTDSRVTNVIAAVMTTGYGLYMVRRFNSYSLRTKLLLGFSVVTVFPLAILGVVNNSTARTLLTNQTNNDLNALASQTAFTVDSYINNQLDTIRTESQLPDMGDFLTLPASERNGSDIEEEARILLVTFARKDPVFIRSYALLDLQGKVLLDTIESDIGSSEKNELFFIEPITTGKPSISDILFTPKGSADLYFSAPVRDETGKIVGVLRARYDAAILQVMARELAKNHPNQNIALVDRAFFVRIAYTAKRELLYKSYSDIALSDLSALQTNRQLPPGSRADILAPSWALVAGLKNMEKQPVFNAPTLGDGSAQAVVAATALNSVPWIAFSEINEEIAFAPINEQSRTTIVVTILMVILAIGAALVMAQILSNPIIHLASIAGQVASGNLGARAKVNTVDEVGNLAATLNTMTDTLQTTLTGLEQRVEERTTALQQANFQSEKRARELQTISEVSSSLATEQKIERLLPLVTRLVSEKFGFYHVGIFLLDSSRRYAVLQAANSEGGWRMLTRGHKLEVGLTGIVGRVAQSGTPRIALDVGEDATFFSNPDLPGTHSEMALPLKARGEIIGVLDVQSTEEAAFSQTDANTLSILADQVAIAIENARLFSQVQRTLAETQALYGQNMGNEWNRQAANRSQVGYLQTLSGGKPVEEPVESAEIRQAGEKGELVVRNSADQTDNLATLTVPLKLRDQTIGVLNVRLPRSHQEWNDTEINMVRSISERVALALENARLYQDAQRRAARERSISELSTKIGTASDIDAILRSTVEELGKSLGNAEVSIQISSENETQR